MSSCYICSLSDTIIFVDIILTSYITLQELNEDATDG